MLFHLNQFSRDKKKCISPCQLILENILIFDISIYSGLLGKLVLLYQELIHRRETLF